MDKDYKFYDNDIEGFIAVQDRIELHITQEGSEVSALLLNREDVIEMAKHFNLI